MNRLMSAVLSDLVVLAEDVIMRPQLIMQRDGERFARIAAEVRHADARPAENIRVTRAAVVMVTAIEGIRAAPHMDSQGWLMLASAALPLLRAETFGAFRNEREQQE